MYEDAFGIKLIVEKVGTNIPNSAPKNLVNQCQNTNKYGINVQYVIDSSAPIMA